ncbi:MAG: OmpH family outer membrane protein [Candidatus Aminicenantes bacterium]|nr:OmpH family outer membrane protein [Candidatus Aminicenantes bacterium]
MELRHFFKTGVLLIFVFAVFLQGSTQETYRIGFVKFERIIQESEAGKTALLQLSQKEKNIKDQLFSFDQQTKALESKLATQQMTLSFDAKQDLISDIDDLKTKQKRYQEDAMKEYQMLQFNLYSRIQQELMPVIHSLAEEKGYSAVYEFSASGILYINPAFDITDEVIRRYNAAKKEAKTDK